MNAPRTLRLVVEYDGTDFHGWQIQPQVRTVQGDLQAALRTVTQESALTLVGAGRTDAGVHAEGQVASLRTRCPLPTSRLCQGLNGLTGPDLVVRAVEEVDPNFHARASATGRVYRYRLLDRRTALHRHRAVAVSHRLDQDILRRASSALVGRHDFTSFAATADPSPSKVCDLRLLTWCRWSEGIELFAEADRFLHHMVRNLVGTLLEVSAGRRGVGEMAAILDARDRRAAGVTAPPEGLTLVRVLYPAALFGRVEGPDRLC